MTGDGTIVLTNWFWGSRGTLSQTVMVKTGVNCTSINISKISIEEVKVSTIVFCKLVCMKGFRVMPPQPLLVTIRTEGPNGNIFRTGRHIE